MKNFYPKQYNLDSRLNIKHNYLSEQFSDYKKILKEIGSVVRNNDFTLGSKVDEFEKKLSTKLKNKYVVSLGSGTDALMLSLKALGVKEGDTVRFVMSEKGVHIELVQSVPETAVVLARSDQS